GCCRRCCHEASEYATSCVGADLLVEAFDLKADDAVHAGPGEDAEQQLGGAEFAPLMGVAGSRGEVRCRGSEPPPPEVRHAIEGRRIASRAGPLTRISRGST